MLLSFKRRLLAKKKNQDAKIENDNRSKSSGNIFIN